MRPCRRVVKAAQQKREWSEGDFFEWSFDPSTPPSKLSYYLRSACVGKGASTKENGFQEVKSEFCHLDARWSLPRNLVRRWRARPCTFLATFARADKLIPSVINTITSVLSSGVVNDHGTR